MIALQHGEPAKSVELLASASPYERAYPDAIYLRGLAYLQMQKGAESAAEFQKIVDHKGANWGATWVHPIGDSTIHSHTWEWPAVMRSRATLRVRKERTRISSDSGKMPTLIFPFSNEPKQTMRSSIDGSS